MGKTSLACLIKGKVTDIGGSTIWEEVYEVYWTRDMLIHCYLGSKKRKKIAQEVWCNNTRIRGTVMVFAMGLWPRLVRITGGKNLRLAWMGTLKGEERERIRMDEVHAIEAGTLCNHLQYIL